ncbi:hypothetical protein A2691_02290 [Candidatus Woesebacteria bacterium RIFCSPHIGHO2_01_FULL_39_23]|uniref:DinB-like domain-containing protein n=1 Tax=candidate division WWE3 bacterium RIFCSPLOWO2_01_FULL_37_15 TaxID=1802622 RepID=A0A1F4UXF2_UNCKA|nr:MAG: hypothetical protein A3A69_00110 [candidate division WWE3 bacterium RIFCSPLOWO2_01_FULL_37_15]OGM22680.1 MAG: hypothetical protein A2691_02290 [Candidatus Woesebacteria bacterium RIFCSPHIGHO2_01_FULL_39_23]
MVKRIVQDLKNSWRNTNSSTIDFANKIPTKIWDEKPFKLRFRSFAWEFSCLVRTRMCYLKGLRIGKLSFSSQEDIPNKGEIVKYSKKVIFDQLTKLSREILIEIEKVDENKVNMVLWLIQHERLHQGKLMLYLSKENLALPTSFVKTWGESNFRKQQEM